MPHGGNVMMDERMVSETLKSIIAKSLEIESKLDAMLERLGRL